MELIKLLGILIIIIGFALKKDAILIIISSAIVTALVGGLGINGLLEVLGSSFINNRSIAIFIVIILVTSTLERNGLKEVAKNLISKIKNISSGSIIGIYAVMRGFFSALNISFGGVAGFVKPIILPMAIGSLESKVKNPNEKHIEELKGMCSSAENIGNFFCNVIFIGSAGALLVQSTLKDLGHNVSLIDLAKAEIPVAITSLVLAILYYYFKDKMLYKKYYINKK
ncbi:MAG: DUF969 domain-containing protein [Clostridiales bacterium]|nr:DUF969 domain-containing protein [Clostridiales bacterium]